MNDFYHILIFEEDENLKCMLGEYLQSGSFQAEIYSDAKEFGVCFCRKECVLCVIDASGNMERGYDLLSAFKTSDSAVPVIFMCQNPRKEDMIRAYRLGADDFVRKPFSMEELQARMLAILRRTQPVRPKEIPVYKLGDFIFDTYKQTLTLGGVSTRLTTKELELLSLLCRNANRLIERSHALKSIWKDDSYFNARSMDVYITKLRRLLKDDPKVSIVNVHGKGYRLEIHPE